jgi:hypothetical protein
MQSSGRGESPSPIAESQCLTTGQEDDINGIATIETPPHSQYGLLNTALSFSLTTKERWRWRKIQFPETIVVSNPQFLSRFQGSPPRLRAVFTRPGVLTGHSARSYSETQIGSGGFMGKIYQAFQKSRGLAAFDADSSTNRMLDTEWGVPEIPPSAAGDITQAVADLLRNKLLTHSFGVQGEWEVRTTLIANRRAWQYRSRVFAHGKEVRKEFPSFDGNLAGQRGSAGTVREDMLAAFAREAVSVHFARSQPRRWHARTKMMAFVLWGVVALVTAYWLWKALGQKTQIYDSPNIYGPVIACSSSCNPRRDSAYSQSLKGNPLR